VEGTAVLEERMKTVRAENEILRADLAATMSGMRTDMAARETRILLWVAGMIGLAVAVLGFGLAFLGFLIGLPS